MVSTLKVEGFGESMRDTLFFEGIPQASLVLHGCYDGYGGIILHTFGV